MKERFGIIGAGGMGTACAVLLARPAGRSVYLWCRREQSARSLRQTRENADYLPGVAIPDSVEITADVEPLADCEALVLAVPMVHLRSTLARLVAHLPKSRPYVSVIKGIEQESFRTPSRVIGELLGSPPLCALTGPSHAEEIARDMMAGVVAASEDAALAETVQQWFSSPTLRVYRSTDLLGAEWAGALKNIIAIAAGIADGLELGDNAKAALVTRGLAEMVRIGENLGAKRETFFGLAGVGDLMTTCNSRHSRNRRVGELLGRGKSFEEILSSTRQVAEGVWTTRSVHDWAARRRISTPVVDEVYAILFEAKEPRRAAVDLMTRDLKPEW